MLRIKICLARDLNPKPFMHALRLANKAQHVIQYFPKKRFQISNNIASHYSFCLKDLNAKKNFKNSLRKTIYRINPQPVNKILYIDSFHPTQIVLYISGTCVMFSTTNSLAVFHSFQNSLLESSYWFIYITIIRLFLMMFICRYFDLFGIRLSESTGRFMK